MRWGLATRGVLTVVPLAVLGIAVLDQPVFAGAACLTALLILLADFGGRDQLAAYGVTALGSVLIATLGTAPLPVPASVALVSVCAAALAVLRGFSGYLTAAAVTLTAELLIAVGMRSAGAPPGQFLSGVAAGALAALLAVRVVPGPQRGLDVQARRLDSLYADILARRRPCSDATGTARELVSAYVTSTDRPAAPTLHATTDLMALAALAHTGDLLASGELRRIEPDPPEPGEWGRQLRVRLRPDGVLLSSAAVAAVLYGGLTWLVMTLTPPHPQWILLGAVTASYPYARRSLVIVRDLLLGTVLAFVVLLVIAPVANDRPWVWWVLLAPAAVIACGAPHGRTGWVVGQIAFTTLSLTLLAVSLGSLHLTSLETRFENVLIGGTCAVVVTALLSPHHARRRLQKASADLYEATGPGPVRAHFLRCADVIETIRGTGFIGVPDLVDWMDAARLSTTVPDPHERASALRANVAVDGEPLLARLSPLLSRSEFSPQSGSKAARP